MTMYVLKPNDRLVCCTGNFTMQVVLAKIMATCMCNYVFSSGLLLTLWDPIYATHVNKIESVLTSQPGLSKGSRRWSDSYDILLCHLNWPKPEVCTNIIGEIYENRIHNEFHIPATFLVGYVPVKVY